jgi:hypothetical protein
MADNGALYAETMTSQYGTAQLTFIKKVRDSVKTNPQTFFAENDWRDIRPKGGRFDSSLLNRQLVRQWQVDDFYVKSVAVWVPHLLIPTHTPTCPNCRSFGNVIVDRAKWIGSPKILYGTRRHRYLDTMLYPCTVCNKTFAGYNKSSMKLDAKVYFGFFNFYLGQRYAVDEELYRDIIESATTECTSSIARRLKTCALSAYYDDHQMYLTAAGAKKIVSRKKQKTMDSFIKPITDAELAKLQRRKVNQQDLVTRYQVNADSAKCRLQKDLVFADLLKSKKNHNVVGDENLIPGLGQAKIEKLMKVDSTTIATEIDNEEARLFDLMETSFKRGNPAPAHKNYHVFAKRWNEMVANKFKEWCNGDEEIIIPRLKSTLQLQEYYDKRERHRSLQSVIRGQDDADRDVLRATLRNNRSKLPEPPRPHVVTPTHYVLQPQGIMPFGNPTTLNAEVAIGIVAQSTTTVQAPGNRILHIPYRVNLPNLPAHRPMPQPKAPVFRSRRFCKTCGWLKSQHTEREGVGDSCRKTYCGKCHLKKIHHTDGNFGPQCTAPTNEHCVWNVSEWYNAGSVSTWIEANY